MHELFMTFTLSLVLESYKRNFQAFGFGVWDTIFLFGFKYSLYIVSLMSFVIWISLALYTYAITYYFIYALILKYCSDFEDFVLDPIIGWH